MAVFMGGPEAVGAVRSEKAEAYPVLAAADRVQQELDRALVVGHHHVDVPVVVDVAEGRATARIAPLERRAAHRRHVVETAGAEVAEELLGLPEHVGLAPARGRVRQLDRAVHRQHIEPSVVVDVQPAGAEARVRQAPRADARLGGSADEGGGAVVHVQVVTLAGQVGDDEILVAVVIEVAGVDAHAGLGPAERAEGRA
jgi:hypothetical protein